MFDTTALLGHLRQKVTCVSNILRSEHKVTHRHIEQLPNVRLGLIFQNQVSNKPLSFSTPLDKLGTQGPLELTKALFPT